MYPMLHKLVDKMELPLYLWSHLNGIKTSPVFQKVSLPRFSQDFLGMLTPYTMNHFCEKLKPNGFICQVYPHWEFLIFWNPLPLLGNSFGALGDSQRQDKPNDLPPDLYAFHAETLTELPASLAPHPVTWFPLSEEDSVPSSDHTEKWKTQAQLHGPQISLFMTVLLSARFLSQFKVL